MQARLLQCILLAFFHAAVDVRRPFRMLRQDTIIINARAVQAFNGQALIQYLLARQEKL